jgi:hypothetical protein
MNTKNYLKSNSFILFEIINFESLTNEKKILFKRQKKVENFQNKDNLKFFLMFKISI